jgi:ABC-type transporter Mla MlaB component
MIYEIITHHNALEVLSAGKLILMREKNLAIDFNHTKKFDSSIFAIILEWKRIANKHNYAMNLIFSPSLLAVIDAYGISKLI